MPEALIGEKEVTSQPWLPGTEGFPRKRGFKAKTGKILGKTGGWSP